MKTLALEADALSQWESFQTPEGVAIRMEVAPFGRRAWAFLIDFIIIVVLTLVILFATSLFIGVTGGDGLGGAIGIVSWFFLLNFYFPLFEGLKSGRTPGKIATKIRVIDRHGGPLTLRSVFTRNFMRDLELWLPLKIIVFGDAIFGAMPGWVTPITSVWAFLLILFPLFNRKRLRLGDLFGGTMVVSYPHIPLLPDLASKPTPSRSSRARGITFTREQLSIYGVFELQVLEDVLRTNKGEKSKMLATVARKIKKKIDWQEGGQETPIEFLESFYKAQRARLEEKMLLGKKKLTKFDDE